MFLAVCALGKILRSRWESGPAAAWRKGWHAGVCISITSVFLCRPKMRTPSSPSQNELSVLVGLDFRLFCFWRLCSIIDRGKDDCASWRNVSPSESHSHL